MKGFQSICSVSLCLQKQKAYMHHNGSHRAVYNSRPRNSHTLSARHLCILWCGHTVIPAWLSEEPSRSLSALSLRHVLWKGGGGSTYVWWEFISSKTKMSICAFMCMGYLEGNQSHKRKFLWCWGKGLGRECLLFTFYLSIINYLNFYHELVLLLQIKIEQIKLKQRGWRQDWWCKPVISAAWEANAGGL